MSDNLYPVSTIAKLLNLTERRVQQLAKDGIIPKSEKGKYNLVGVIKSYVKYLQELAFGRHAGGTADEAGSRARLIAAKAAIAEIELEKAKGDMVSVSIVADWWDSIVFAAKTRLLSVPSRAAPLVFGVTSLSAAQAVIENLITESLNELSAINPVPSVAGDESVETAAETDSEPMGGRGEVSKPRKQRRARKVED